MIRVTMCQGRENKIFTRLEDCQGMRTACLPTVSHYPFVAGIVLPRVVQSFSIYPQIAYPPPPAQISRTPGYPLPLERT